MEINSVKVIRLNLSRSQFFMLNYRRQFSNHHYRKSYHEDDSDSEVITGVDNELKELEYCEMNLNSVDLRDDAREYYVK